MNIFTGFLKSKLLVISFILLIVAVIVFFVQSSLLPQKVTLTPGQEFSEPKSDKITTANNVVINNIYKNDQVTYDSGTTVIEKNNQYQIIYNPGEDLFTITIVSEGFEGARKLAENGLLNKLGISQTDACRLRVTINTLPQVNPVESEQDYPLSFCQ